MAAAAVAAAYAVQFRPESLLIRAGHRRCCCGAAPETSSDGRGCGGCGLLFVALVAAHVGHLFAVRNEGWGTSEARLSLGYVAREPSGERPVLPGRRAVSRRLHAARARRVCSAAGSGTERVRARSYISRCSSAIDLLFYAGSYNYGADVRYSLMTYPPLAILGGLGARARRQVGPSHQPGCLPAHARRGRARVPVSLVRPARPRDDRGSLGGTGRRPVCAVVRSAICRRNSYVLTHNPGMFHVWGVNAGQMSLIVSNPSYLDYLTDRYAGGVYLHWNFWCNVQDPVQREFCRQALENRPVGDRSASTANVISGTRCIGWRRLHRITTLARSRRSST